MAEDRSASQTRLSQCSMRNHRFLAMVDSPAPVLGMLALMQMPASCQPWPGAYWRSKTLAVPWTVYPRLGCTQIFTSCRATGQLGFPQGAHKMLQNCQKPSFSGFPPYTMFICLFLSLFLSMSQSAPCF